MASNQWRMMRSTAESAPSLALVLLMRSGQDPVYAGWVGCALAVTVLVWFTLRRVESDTILLGVNVYIAVITPLITGLFYLGLDPAAQLIVDNVQFGLMAAITGVGLYLHLRGAHGFVGDEDAHEESSASAILVAASAGAALWSALLQGEMIFGVVIPIMVLFAVRGILIARVRDRAG